MIDLAPLVNKTVPLKFRGAELRLELSHALFSSYDVDAGTRLLLKAVGRDEVLATAGRVLDSGCGVGVIGLAVAAAFPSCQVEARDRDLLACAFTARNRRLNRISNLRVGPGLLSVKAPGLWTGDGGETPPEGPYDYILTNIPAKAGGPVLEAFFAGAPALLAPRGRLAVVIVNPLVDMCRAALAASGFEIVAEERGANHRAFVAQVGANGGAAGGVAGGPSGSPATASPLPADAMPASTRPAAQPAPAIACLDFSGLDLSLYQRRRGSFKLAGISYEASGIWGLPEFDTVGYGSVAAAELAVRALPGSLVRSALVVNPGIGNLPIWLTRRLAPESITAASRDVLSLAATGANLAAQPKPRPEYRAWSSLELAALPDASFDLIVWNPDIVPEYDWIGPVWEEASRLLKTGASLLIACPPTELARFEKRRPQGFRKTGEKRKKAFEAGAWLRG
jgi:16S rRNA G1207 methylase RsmC